MSSLSKFGSTVGLIAFAVGFAAAQEPRVDAGVTYTAARSLKSLSGENFWMQGGSIELGADVWKGVGIAAKVTGLHASSIGTSGVPISIVTAVFGPRYRRHGPRGFSIYGEALGGEANGFNSLFPTAKGVQIDDDSVALELGGGVDLALKKYLAVRVVDASWLRTQLPNATNNVQNNVVLGAGLVVRFGR